SDPRHSGGNIYINRNLSRGIGLQFCKHLLEKQSTIAVVATSRDPENVHRLHNLAQVYPGRISVVKIDVTKGNDIKDAAEKVKDKFGSLDLLINCAAILHPSRKGETNLGGWYSYHMSKAALNMATKNLSIEMGRGRDKVACVALHPGTVETDLSVPYRQNVSKEKLFSAAYSVQCLMNVIDGLSLHKTGRFLAWDGSELTW
uniref:Zgc:65997 n=1 Tax=Erpetoichthys calabaricus TaxID=27687 RepID=A0A8C4RMG0_ERPCA